MQEKQGNPNMDLYAVHFMSGLMSTSGDVTQRNPLADEEEPALLRMHYNAMV